MSPWPSFPVLTESFGRAHEDWWDIGGGDFRHGSPTNLLTVASKSPNACRAEVHLNSGAAGLGIHSAGPPATNCYHEFSLANSMSASSRGCGCIGSIATQSKTTSVTRAANMGIAIRLAESPYEIEAVHRFRYAVYVEEMNRPQKHADHAKRHIVDQLDESCHLFAAWEDDEIVGTVRTNFLRESNIGDYFEMYHLACLAPNDITNTSITTRLMIAPPYRRSTLAVRMAREIFGYGLQHRITTDVIDCNSHLVPFFAGLGYTLHRNDLIHPEYGSVTVMKLVLSNANHILKMKAPY